ncbi:MAG TPA: translation initiation factor IF-2 [Chloroflexota bacterium]
MARGAPRGARRPSRGPARGAAVAAGPAPAAPTRALPVGPVSLPPALTVKDLAERLTVSPAAVIRELLQNGVIASINQTVDFDTAAIVASDLGIEVHETALEELAETPEEEAENEEHLVLRPPVITVMGHVDHGKTTVLDSIRKTSVAAGEAGGITQHIGAYQVEVHGHQMTFLDTPGHEAFTAMRARGAKVTDIAVLVVAADEGVMAQTREAADHAKAAGVPIVIALNKMDRPNANPDRVKQQLAEIGLVVEEYGGDIVSVPMSARNGEGIDALLEMLLVISEMGNHRANPTRPASGTVIEAKLDKARGPVATVLVQNGTLHTGDVISAGGAAGRIKALFNDRAKRVRSAEPSTPVEVLGLDAVPEAGDRFQVLADERTARLIAQGTRRVTEARSAPARPTELEAAGVELTDLNLIIKADERGSLEALVGSIQTVAQEETVTQEVRTKIVRSDIGNVTESDVMLAAAAQAIIIAFEVRVEPGARRAAETQGIDIRSYNVIYHVTEDLEQLLHGMLKPEYREVITGQAEVRQVFKIGKGRIAGCYVTSGTISRSNDIRIFRAGEPLFRGRMAGLKRFKDDVREVQTGYECGISIEGFADIQEGDIIEAYTREVVT